MQNSLRALALGVIVALGLPACAGPSRSVTTVPAAGAPATGPKAATRMALDTSTFDYTTNPHVVDVPSDQADPASPDAFRFTPSQCAAAFGFACYQPKHIRKGYNVPAALTGAGQTIVIVDAFGSPTIAQDLQLFDRQFGLPDPALRIVYPEKTVTNTLATPNQVGWAFETTLDVEWAHAIAPGAAIVLVVADTNAGKDLDDAQAYAVNNQLGNVMSLSFGIPEAFIKGGGNNIHWRQADKTYQAAQAAGISVFASAGDSGAGNGTATISASFPASDPLVTSVGGTNLFLSDAGAYQGEFVWNDANPALCPFGCRLGVIGATGGAPSNVFDAPDYQSALSGRSARTVADVGYNASVYTGILVVQSFNQIGPRFNIIGGTSEGAPQWAAIAALANQAAGHALGFLNSKLYGIGANPAQYAASFHDVVIGDNGFGTPGFSASPGYDIPTGLGTPNVAQLIPNLLAH